MNKFEQWIFKKIIRKEIVQGNHKQNLINIHKIIRDQLELEFTEDNNPSLDSFSFFCFYESQKDK